jgi:hypothetical protein
VSQIDKRIWLFSTSMYPLHGYTLLCGSRAWLEALNAGITLLHVTLLGVELWSSRVSTPQQMGSLYDSSSGNFKLILVWLPPDGSVVSVRPFIWTTSKAIGCSSWHLSSRQRRLHHLGWSRRSGGHSRYSRYKEERLLSAIIIDFDRCFVDLSYFPRTPGQSLLVVWSIDLTFASVVKHLCM